MLCLVQSPQHPSAQPAPETSPLLRAGFETSFGVSLALGSRSGTRAWWCRSGAGAVPMRCQTGAGVVLEQCRCGAGAVLKQCRCGTEAVPVQCQCGAEAVPVQCQCGASAVPEQCWSSTGVVPMRYQCGAGAMLERCRAEDQQREHKSAKIPPGSLGTRALAALVCTGVHWSSVSPMAALPYGRDTRLLIPEPQGSAGSACAGGTPRESNEWQRQPLSLRLSISSPPSHVIRWEKAS